MNFTSIINGHYFVIISHFKTQSSSKKISYVFYAFFFANSFSLLFRTCPEWVNPGQYGLVVVTSSDGRNLPYGRLEDILSRDSSALNCHTNDDKRAWFSIDLGLWLLPSSYTLRHARGYGRSALRNWLFQVCCYFIESRS